MTKTRYLNSKEASEYLGISRHFLYQAIREGRLKAHKFGGDQTSKKHYRFTTEDLDSFLKGEKADGENN